MSPEEKPLVTRKYILDQVFYGVYITMMRTIVAASIAIPLAIGFPILGVAEAPKSVQIEQALQAEDQRVQALASGEEPSALDRGIDFMKGLPAAAKEGATSMWDGLTNKDEQVKQLQAERDEWRAQALEYRRQISEKNMRQGLQHDLMVQCLKDATMYLESIPK